MSKEKQSLVFRCGEVQEEMKELSDFHLRQRLDVIMVDGIFLTLITAFIIPDARNGVALTLIFLLAILGLYFWESVFCVQFLKKSLRYRSAEFQGDIDSLILAFARAGLFLHKQTLGKYVFKSRNIILPNTELIVREGEDRCFIIGSEKAITSLEKFFTV